MIDTPKLCTHCKGLLPARRGDLLVIERRRDGFVGTYCSKEECQSAGYVAALDDGKDS